jgi:hypothetical protein
LDLSPEKVTELDQLIKTEKQNIEDLHYLENLGFKLFEDVNGYLTLMHNGIYRKSMRRSLFFGIPLSIIFIYLTVFSIVGAAVGLPSITVNFYYLIATGIYAVIAGTGIVLVAKGIERSRRRKNFKFSANANEYLLIDGKNSRTFPKSEYKVDVNIKDSTYHVMLKSNTDELEIFNLTFSNTKLHKTLKFLLHTLNEYK